MAGAACLLVGLTAACGGSGSAAQAPGAAVPTPTMTAKAPASPTPTETENRGVPVGQPVGDGLISAGLVRVPGGSYTQVQASPDNACLRLDQGTVKQSALDVFLASDISEAQKVAGKFVLKDVINSPLMADYTPDAATQWLTAQKGVFTDLLIKNTQDNVTDGSAGGAVSAYAETDRPYNLTSDGTPRVVSATCQVTKIVKADTKDGSKGLWIYMKVDWQNRGVVTKGSGVERSFGRVAFGLKQVGDHWEIDSFSNRFRGIVAADGSLDRSNDPTAFEFDNN